MNSRFVRDSNNNNSNNNNNIIIIVIIRYSRGNETFAGEERFAAKVCEFADPLR
jgi:hypothetical protein